MSRAGAELRIVFSPGHVQLIQVMSHLLKKRLMALMANNTVGFCEGFFTSYNEVVVI